jgi:hypothetical protein
MMNGHEAAKLDKGSKYVDFDADSEMYGIFGTESGFCYRLYTSQEEAEAALEG